MVSASPKTPWSKEILAVLGIFLVVNLSGALFQQNVNVNDGKGWDGLIYFSSATAFAHHQRPHDVFPFVLRIGTPYLASLFKDIFHGFLVVNLTANLLTVLLLAVWLRSWIDRWDIRVLLSLLFQTNWISPIRIIWFNRTTSDHWAAVFILTALILMRNDRNLPRTAAALSLLTFLGVFFREIIVIIPITFLFIDLRWDDPVGSFFERMHVKVLPLLAFFAGWVLLYDQVDIKITLHSYLSDTYRFTKDFPIARWSLVWFSAFGPFIAIAFTGPQLVFRLFRENPWLLAAFGSIVALSYAGSGEERYFISWLSPIVLLAVGIVLEKGKTVFNIGWVLAVMLFLQTVSQRVFWTTPGQATLGRQSGLPVFLSPFSDRAQYLDLLNQYEQFDVLHTRLHQYLLVSLLFILLQVWYASTGRLDRPGGPSPKTS